MLWKSLLLIFDMRTCGLSHQIKGPTTVKLAIFLMKPVLATFTVVGPIIWCDNPQVRMWKILYTNNNDFHHLGRSQLCAGAWYVFSPSKPHSRTLWAAFESRCGSIWIEHILAVTLYNSLGVFVEGGSVSGAGPRCYNPALLQLLSPIFSS